GRPSGQTPPGQAGGMLSRPKTTMGLSGPWRRLWRFRDIDSARNNTRRDLRNNSAGASSLLLSPRLRPIRRGPSLDRPLPTRRAARATWAASLPLDERRRKRCDIVADQHNWVNAYNQSEQIETNGYGIYCSATTGTGPPDIEVLEYFTPGFLNDPFHWIPKGLMYDLMDNGEPPQTNFNDQVSGFTIAQIFSALQSDFNPISQYKARILLQNNNSQQTQINNLFTSYGY